MRLSGSSQLLVCLTALTLLPAASEAQPYHPPRPRPPMVGAPMPPGPGRLRNRAQGMCLDVDGWNGQGSGNVLLWDCNGDPDHAWSFTRSGELVNAVGGVCLDAAGYAGQAGANVGVYRCEHLNDQRWSVVPRGDGSFEIHNRKQNLCLDVNGQAGARGDNVLLWNCDGGADQRWTFEPWTASSPRYVGPPRHRPPGDPPEQPWMDPPPPHVMPPPPPPQSYPPAPAVRPIRDGELRALKSAIDNAGFSQDKLTVIEEAARSSYFLVGQAKEILGQLAFSADKLHALELLAPRLLDRKNTFQLYEAFSFSADKDQAREILRRNGY